MPTPHLPKSSTPLSTTSSLATNNTSNAVQSGSYTKAQFQSTMEGSRSVKNPKEIEQLLRDYPAALELYRTGKYKVKVKYEADVERVILVEKRSSRGATTNGTTSNDNDAAEKNSSLLDVSNSIEKAQQESKAEKESLHSRSRTQSRDTLGLSNKNGANDLVHTTTSSMRRSSNAQPKVDQHRTPSKDRDASLVSQPKQGSVQPTIPQKSSSHRRSQSRDSQSIISHTKHQGRKSQRDYAKMIVPYVQNPTAMPNMWNQQRAVQPYYSNPMLNQPRSSMYMPPTVVASQNALYQPPYPYAQQPSGTLPYQNPAIYAPAPPVPSYSNITNGTLHSSNNYGPSNQSMMSSKQGIPAPPSTHTFNANQQAYQVPSVASSMYQSQMQLRLGMPMVWPGMTQVPMVPPMAQPQAGSYTEFRRGSKHRARSVDTGPRNHPAPPNSYARPQPGPEQSSPPGTGVHYHHHHHHHHRRHHHHRPPPTDNPPEATVAPAPVSFPTTTTKDATAVPPPGQYGEKLTIRQLNEMFVQADPTGRLPYSSIPNIMQRFGIALTETDLSSAAQELQYNVNEPISARRLVHVLVKLGKIAKSTHQSAQQQQRTAPSPSMLPEDREVTDILTQRQNVQNVMYPSGYPTYWQ